MLSCELKEQVEKVIIDLGKKFSSLEYIKNQLSKNSSMNQELLFALPSINILMGQLIKQYDEDLFKISAHNNIVLLNGRISEYCNDISSFYGYSLIGFSTLAISNNKNLYKNFLEGLNKYIVIGVNNIVKQEELISMPVCECINGLAGIGRYLLEFKEVSSVLEAIKGILIFLIKLTKKKITANKYEVRKWFIEYESQSEIEKKNYSYGHTRIGMAHGIVGILSLLAIAKIQGVEVEGQEEAIKDILSYLYKFRIEEKGLVYWPYKVGIEERQGAKDAVNYMPSWCYGSGGIARAIYLAGKAIEDDYYIEDSISCIRKFCALDIDKLGFISPTFCHGYSGWLHIVNLFYKDTGEKEFEPVINNLASRILTYYNEDNPLGFKNLEYDDNLEVIEEDHISFVRGTVSVLLPLLGLINDKKDNEWDHIFLLN
ncbi:lanthionine synthetase C family protein [Clostridium cellulovorans]|uniref:Lanthionine synthetase C family protein n=1 Tax=Clostridium cellulovorans (strain ATCC 35296 / DSM 3052 / OCM 3 / 743B) TaxID=573061 RepID=D9SND1_CLOC7|nr:lanthionine synthetase C family protein [Clostridium cellulovorans]ADL53923.1 Lanthionine synthetase C family protein [Clostridium cellulovorans 743B]